MASRCDPAFEPLLHPFARRDLDRRPATVFGLWSDWRIAYVNDAWDRFATDNGGQPAIGERWDLGASYLDAVPGLLHPFYQQLYDRSGGSRHPSSHDYECSSPDQYRCFHMDVYALADRAGFIVVNSLLVERPHDDGIGPPVAVEYHDEHGMLHQCMHCRRVENLLRARWDWVPAWVERVPQHTSHGLCPVCLAYYYPAAE